MYKNKSIGRKFPPKLHFPRSALILNLFHYFNLLFISNRCVNYKFFFCFDDSHSTARFLHVVLRGRSHCDLKIRNFIACCGDNLCRDVFEISSINYNRFFPSNQGLNIIFRPLYCVTVETSRAAGRAGSSSKSA